MNYPISLFILDISNSSQEEGIGEELTRYLDQLVDWITIWTKDAGQIKVKHRSGDEIIFIGDGYATAYTLAFYISNVWKFSNHNPYFGLAFGDIDKDLPEIDIEKWIHPLIKQARYANDLLKQDQHRPQFKFELDQFYQGNSFTYNEFRYEFETFMNTLLRLQQKYIWNQTEIQKQVSSLYFILQRQKDIAKLLHKTAPTISSHLKKGNSEEILHVFTEINNILISLQKKAYLDEHPKEKSEQLNNSIRKHLKENIDSLIEINRGELC